MSECTIPFTHNLKDINDAIYAGYTNKVPANIEEIIKLFKLTNDILYVDEVVNKYKIKGTSADGRLNAEISKRISALASDTYAKAGGRDKTKEDDTKKQMQLGNALHSIGHVAGLMYAEMKKLPENRALGYNYNSDEGKTEDYKKEKKANNDKYEANITTIQKVILDYLTKGTAHPDPDIQFALTEVARNLNLSNTDKNMFVLEINSRIITDMVMTTMFQIDEVYKKQFEIDPLQNPTILFEQAVMDLTLPESLAGRGDIIVVFSNMDGGYIDYKTYEPKSIDSERLTVVTGENTYVNKYITTQSGSHGYARYQKWRKTIPAYEKVLKNRYGIKNIRMSRVVPIATFWGKTKALGEIAGQLKKKGISEEDAKALFKEAYSQGKTRSNIVYNIESAATLPEIRPVGYTKKIVDIIISKEIIGDPTIAAFVEKKTAQIEAFKNARIKSSSEQDKKLLGDKIAAISNMINNVVLFDSLAPTMDYLKDLAAEIKDLIENNPTSDDPAEQLDITHRRIVQMHRLSQELEYYDDLVFTVQSMYKDNINVSKIDAELIETEAKNLTANLRMLKEQLKQEEYTLLSNIDSRIKSNTNDNKVAFEKNGIFKQWVRGASNSNNPFINMMFSMISKLNIKAENDFGRFLKQSDKIFVELNNWMASSGWTQKTFEDFLVNPETGNIKSMYNNTINAELKKYDSSGNEASAKKEALKFFTENFTIKPTWEKRYKDFFNSRADSLLSKYKILPGLANKDKRDTYLKSIKGELENYAYSNNFYDSTVTISYDEATNEVKYGFVNKTTFNLNAWRNAKNRNINTEWSDKFKNRHYNDTYKFMQANPPLLNWYEHWKASMIEARHLYGIYDSGKIPVGFIPNMHKEAIDMMASNGIVTGAMNTFNVQWQHLQIDNDDLFVQHDENGNEIKGIPIPFLNPIKIKKIVDGKEVYVADTASKSFDMQRLLVEFMRSAYAYKYKQQEEPLLLALRDVMEDKGAMYVSDKQGKLVEKDGTVVVQDVKEFGKKEIEAYNTYLDVYMYGKPIVSEDYSIGGLSMNKTITAAQKLYADKVLKYNIFAPIAAYFAGTANTWLTGVKGNAFNSKDWTQGIKRKGSHIGTSFSEATEEGKKAKMFLHRFDPYMRSEYANAGLERTNKNMLQKFFTDRAGFYLFQKADDLLMDTISFSMADAYIIDENGKLRHRSMIKPAELKNNVYKSLWESFVINETTDSVGVKIVGFDGKELTQDQVDDIIIAFKNATRETQRGIMGSQSEQDIALYSTQLLGRMIGQFRNWIPNLINEMGKNLEYNKNTDIVDIGRFTTVAHIISQSSSGTLASSAAQFAKIIAFTAIDLIPYINLLSRSNDANEAKARAWFENWKRNHPQLSKDIDGNEITFEQYNNAKKAQLRVLAYQLRVLALMIAMTMLLGADWDDDDQPDYRKYFGTRFAYKLLNRTWRELASMFSFSDFDSLIGGGAIPMWSLARDMVKLLGNTADEARDVIAGENSKKDITPVGYYTISWISLLSRIRQVFELSDQAYRAVR
mgnify:FL=1